jgi:Transcriptional regulators
MDKSFHYLLMINQAIFQKKVFHKLQETGLTPGQPKILDYLSTHDGSTQKNIAYACQIDPATVTGILRRMEEKGLIERKFKDGNRRSVHVFLTETGRNEITLIHTMFQKLEKEAFDGISPEEREQFMIIFYKICCNLTDTEGLQ